MAYLNASPKSTTSSRSYAGALDTVKASPLVRNPHLWGLGLGSFALGLVNGALVLSCGIGWVTYKQLLALSPRQWDALKQQIEEVLPLPGSMRHQALVLSILLTVSTFTMTSLWQATHSLLMAVVLMGQTALTFFVVGLLLRTGGFSKVSHEGHCQRKNRDGKSSPGLSTIPSDPVEQSLGQLSHPDPLQRLVAVRRLVKLIDAMGNERLYAVGAQVTLRSHLLDCFHILLAHESEPIVRTAVREGLDLLRQPHQLPEGPPPLPEEKALQSQAYMSNAETALNATHQRHRPVEYVEYVEP